MAGEALAVTAVVALVHLALAASELGQAAALLGPVLGQETRALVEAVALAGPCSHGQTTVRHTHTHTPGCNKALPGPPKPLHSQTILGSSRESLFANQQTIYYNICEETPTFRLLFLTFFFLFSNYLE